MEDKGLYHFTSPLTPRRVIVYHSTNHGIYKEFSIDEIEKMSRADMEAVALDLNLRAVFE